MYKIYKQHLSGFASDVKLTIESDSNNCDGSRGHVYNKILSLGITSTFQSEIASRPSNIKCLTLSSNEMDLHLYTYQ